MLYFPGFECSVTPVEDRVIPRLRPRYINLEMCRNGKAEWAKWAEEQANAEPENLTSVVLIQADENLGMKTPGFPWQIRRFSRPLLAQIFSRERPE
jgi:hypothetical protein